MATAGEITILHVSDLHISPAEGGGQRQQLTLLEKFGEFLSDWKGNASMSPPDLLLVSGDLAHHGKVHEYKLAAPDPAKPSADGVLTKVCEVFNLARSRVCFTPGNHDVDRDFVAPEESEGHLRIAKTPDSLHAFFFDSSKAGLRQNVFRRLTNFYNYYCSFYAEPRPTDPDAQINHLYTPRLIRASEGAPRDVLVAPICTSWLSQSYYKARMAGTLGEHDGEPPSCLAACTAKISDALKPAIAEMSRGLRIALMHHPMDWLVEWEKPDLREFLGRNFHLVLCGHIHRNDVYTPQLEQMAHTIGCGAFYLDSSYRNQFNILRVSFNGDAPRSLALKEVEWNGHEWKPIVQTRHLTEKHQILGYRTEGEWLFIPLLEDLPPIRRVGDRVVVSLPAASATDEATLLPMVRALIASLSEDGGCTVVRSSPGSLTLEISVETPNVFRLAKRLQESDERWREMCDALGVTEIKAAGRRFYLKPHRDARMSDEGDYRRRVLTDHDIAHGFDIGPGAVWRTLGDCLQDMFRIRGIDDCLIACDLPPQEQQKQEEAENLSPDARPSSSVTAASQDWSWYCTERLGVAGQTRIESHEELLHNCLKESVTHGSKKVILIHGGTGHGKTTFLRHFFKCDIWRRDKEMAQRLRVIRIPLAVAGMTIDKMEDDVDHKIHRFFSQHYPELDEVEHILGIGKLALSGRSAQITNEYLASFPHRGTVAERHRWLLSIVGRQSDVLQSYFADINRLKIDYLARIGRKKIVIIFDNIDQMPRAIQEAAFMLARHKLEWVEDTNDVTIIIVFRSYMLSKAAKELSISAYQTRYEVRIHPCLVGSILSRRVKFFRDKLEQNLKKGAHFQLGTIPGTLDPGTLAGLVDFWVSVFNRASVNTWLGQITNYDLREQIRMVEAVFRSPNFDWHELLLAIGKNPEQIEHRVSSDKLLDILLRGTNQLVSIDSPRFFLNVFNASDLCHFSNTLNMMYILSCVDRSGQTYVDNIVAVLAVLGHSPEMTRHSVATLLRHNILLSDEGIFLTEDKVSEVRLGGQDSPRGREYLSALPFRLFYMQAMAYQTPLEEEFAQCLSVPNEYGGEVREFEQRVRAAAALAQQVARDERMQLLCIQGSSRVQAEAEHYGLLHLAAKMRTSAHEQLETIRKTNANWRIDWAQLRSLFDCG